MSSLPLRPSGVLIELLDHATQPRVLGVEHRPTPLIGPLRLDQIGDLADRIDVGRLDEPLRNAAAQRGLGIALGGEQPVPEAQDPAGRQAMQTEHPEQTAILGGQRTVARDADSGGFDRDQNG
jgi:hypothetical protein